MRAEDGMMSALDGFVTYGRSRAVVRRVCILLCGIDAHARDGHAQSGASMSFDSRSPGRGPMRDGA